MNGATIKRFILPAIAALFLFTLFASSVLPTREIDFLFFLFFLLLWGYIYAKWSLGIAAS